MGQVSDARAKLVNSALELMYARSYADVGVQELCTRAGVQKGSFYHFFPSKRDLTLAALERQSEIARRTIIEPAFSSTLPPLKRLEVWFSRIHDHLASVKRKTGHVPGCPMGNLACEMSTQDEVIRLKVDSMFKDLAGLIERTLAEAVDRGDIAPQDTRRSAQAILAYMEGVLLLAKAKNDPSVIKKLGQGFVRQLVQT